MSNWFAWLDYGFMKNALIAILIITPLFGLMGTMIVNKKMAYFSDALGHSALTGIAVGVVKFDFHPAFEFKSGDDLFA